MAKAQPQTPADVPGALDSHLSGKLGLEHMSTGVGAQVPSEKREREQFGVHEVAIVLSRFDLGSIQTIKDFPRGSRRSPKLIVITEKGAYLLKRRAKGKDEMYKVTFCHGLQLHLARKQFPLPLLIGTREENESMVQFDGAIYELFEYINGEPYSQSLEATTDAGKILALFHKLLMDYESEYKSPRGSYHASRSVAQGFQLVPKTLSKLATPEKPVDMKALARLLKSLHAAYNDAAMRVHDLGLNEWPAQIIHSDWHPGNTLYKGNRVVAVIDYDASRSQQRIVDVANGALQFSMIGGGDDPSKWPDYIDVSRFKRFLIGYDSVYNSTPDLMLSVAELRTIPLLMIEALIAEAVLPIAAQGKFARIDGMDFLVMVERKAMWIRKHADQLIAALES